MFVLIKSEVYNQDYQGQILISPFIGENQFMYSNLYGIYLQFLILKTSIEL